MKNPVDFIAGDRSGGSSSRWSVWSSARIPTYDWSMYALVREVSESYVGLFESMLENVTVSWEYVARLGSKLRHFVVGEYVRVDTFGEYVGVCWDCLRIMLSCLRVCCCMF